MLKHVSAPAHSFTQVPNEIIRHPRLSPEAKTLLLWQLSLPTGVDVSLSETAKRAGIKKTAFTRAKRELMAEGYVHEWRRQGFAGRWATRQLVSNTPLAAEQAAEEAAAASGRPPAAPEPAVGEPTPRAVGRPQENTGENTPPPPHHPLAERGAQALALVTRGERRLRLSSRDVRALAPLVAEWLQRGASLREIRDELTSGLPDQVRSARGLLRNRLLRKMPDPAPEPTPAPSPLRACAGGCGRMIRPTAHETQCRDCRYELATAVPHDDASGAVAATRRGVAAIREALTPFAPGL
ncbi:hypothetical protein [Streptomyces triculaminicus]|uniref:hypothetical protein n=1 Tax=Streptomyces triculaminicus TaxID=2816232 RepID=UPI0037D7BD0E